MTQLFRAAAPPAAPGIPSGGRGSRPVLHGGLARAAALLALAGLAGCADSLTAPATRPLAEPRMAVSAANVVGRYSLPIAPNSLTGTSTLPWGATGIVVPAAGKYRIRVQGAVTVSQFPTFPGPCPQGVFTDFLGEWGPQGRPALGNYLRVAVFTRQATDWGFPLTEIDATTVETEQQLEANTPIWVARQGLGVEVRCSAHPEPIPMFAFSSGQVLTVEQITDPILECKGADGASTIERGKTVRCAITPDKAYKVLGRRSTGTGFTIAEAPGTSHGANTEYVWQGSAVAGSRVSVDLELTGDDGAVERKTFTTSFHVSARDWPKLTLNDPSVSIGLREMAPFPNRKNGVLGNALAQMNFDILDRHPVARPNGGPNGGLMYLAEPWPAVDFSIVLHPGLYGDASAPEAARRWHADQNGRGSGTCTQSVFAALEPAVRRHEGVTKAPNSHWGVAQSYFQGSETEQLMEKVYRQTTDAGLVRQDAFN
ncbi:hypothetical protein, partial [Longimicrobium sp.]|uniref:hypothetical protein n=1 Tax=Longimicrobium sp. TaxID=2029185 RepID=UPI002E33842B